MLKMCAVYAIDRYEILRYVQQQNFKDCALVIIDMWDKHWCKTISLEADLLAVKIDKFANEFRYFGGTVIHAAYFCMPDPGPGIKSPIAKQFLKFSAFRGCKCCDLACQKFRNKPVWSKINSAIYVDKTDHTIIKHTDLFKLKNIKNYFLVGQHVNECMLERPVGCFNLKFYGKDFCIIQDLVNEGFIYSCPKNIKQEFFELISFLRNR
jgi:hypothetical protein